MGNDALFRWIDLSDIHFGHGDAEHGWDQKLVLQKLGQDIAATVTREGWAIDAVFVTGDVAFSGGGRRPTEYADAKAWLGAIGGAIGVPATRIFVVAGNHDVNRKVDDDDDVARLVRDLRDGRAALDTELAKPKMRARLASRQEGFLELAAGFAPFFGEPPNAAVDRLFWMTRFRARGLPIRVIGLNTALLAADERVFESDHGKLRLGKEQLATALVSPAVEEGELCVVLSHHPLRSGWLADGRDADAILRSNAHIHLSGHVHEADSEGAYAGSGGHFVRVVAGAAHGEADSNAPARHGYNFGAIVVEGDALRLHIQPRAWSPKNADFRLDVDNVPKGRAHASHEIPIAPPRLHAGSSAGDPRAPTKQPIVAARDVALDVATFLSAAPAPPATAAPRVQPPSLPAPPPPATAAPSVVAGQPAELFVSYCPADEALWKPLKVHLDVARRQPGSRFRIQTSEAATAGAAFVADLEQRIAAAHVVLLLLSADYLASDFIFDVELEAIRRRWEAGEIVVVPILMKPFSREQLRSTRPGALWFDGLRNLPRNEVPIAAWTLQDEAFTQVATEIKTIIGALRPG